VTHPKALEKVIKRVFKGPVSKDDRAGEQTEAQRPPTPAASNGDVPNQWGNQRHDLPLGVDPLPCLDCGKLYDDRRSMSQHRAKLQKYRNAFTTLARGKVCAVCRTESWSPVRLSKDLVGKTSHSTFCSTRFLIAPGAMMGPDEVDRATDTNRKNARSFREKDPKCTGNKCSCEVCR